MGNKDAKVIRGQIRQVAVELLPSILDQEFSARMYTQLQKEITFKLEEIQATVNTTLNDMNKRAQDVQAFMMSQIQADMARNAPQIPAPDTSSNNLEIKG